MYAYISPLTERLRWGIMPWYSKVLRDSQNSKKQAIVVYERQAYFDYR